MDIIGLSPLQQDLADKIWALDSQEALTEFVSCLPRSLRREVQVVMELMVLAAFDQVQDTDLAEQTLAQFTK